MLVVLEKSKRIIPFIRKFWWLLACSLAIILGFFIWYLIKPDFSFLSPLSDKEGLSLFRKKAQVIGFLPYWNLKEETEVNFDVIDQLIYFGLTVNEKGKIIKEEEMETEPGWYKLQESNKLRKVFKEAREKKKKVLFSLICFDSQVADEIVSNPVAREKLISEVAEVVKENSFDGVDVDFEYFPGEENIKDFGDKFNRFLLLLKIRLLKENPAFILSVDIYPKAFIEDKPYKLKELGNIADQIIMMAYDFTQRSSDQAGPVAPIKGESEKELSIARALRDSFDKIDNQKLVLGIPLYGYEWQTVSEEPRSAAYPQSGVTASYERVMNLIEEKNLTVNWDEVAYSPWIVYQDGWAIKQIYFDNLKSIAIKTELTQQLYLKGLAFWALGYEGQREEIWKYLQAKL